MLQAWHTHVHNTCMNYVILYVSEEMLTLFACNNTVSFWTLCVETNEKSKCKYGYQVILLIVDVTFGTFYVKYRVHAIQTANVILFGKCNIVKQLMWSNICSLCAILILRCRISLLDMRTIKWVYIFFVTYNWTCKRVSKCDACESGHNRVWNIFNKIDSGGLPRIRDVMFNALCTLYVCNRKHVAYPTIYISLAENHGNRVERCN